MADLPTNEHEKGEHAEPEPASGNTPMPLIPAAPSAAVAEEFVLLASQPDPHASRYRRHQDAGWLRLVIVMWCFWLLGAWAVAWLSDTSVPRVRWMLFAGTFGLMLVWPAFRLSGARR